MAVLDRDLRFLEVDDALAAMHGIPAAVHIGQTVGALLPGLASAIEPVIRQVFASGVPVVDLELHGEVPAAPGARGRWLASYYPVHSRGFAVLAVETVVRAIAEERGEQAVGTSAAVDVAAHKQSEAEQARLFAAAEAAARSAEEATRLRDQVVAQLAHDLKSPLTAVKGQADLLLRRLAGPEPPTHERLAHGLERIAAAASQMTAQIDELLDSAQIRAGQPIELQRTPADLVALVRRRTEEFAGLSELHSMVLQIEADTLHGDWDVARLERVIDNLLGNALKYSPAGGQITLALRREDDGQGSWAVLAVADQGIGIPTGDLPTIFEQFHRGANVIGRIGGTGLGLASAHFIIAAHSGTITATSQEGTGSTFTVRLPLAPPGL